MTPETTGLHHSTAIAGDPQRNADFYVGVLGLQFVKRTGSHDDTGTNITFFPWTETGRAGQTRTATYNVSRASFDYWTDRLEAEGVSVERTERFGETVLAFKGPDGIGLELGTSLVLPDQRRAQFQADAVRALERQHRLAEPLGSFDGNALGF